MLIRYLILPLLLLTTAAAVAQVHDDDAYDGPRHARCGTETLMNIRAQGGPRNKAEREFLAGASCNDRSPKQFDQLTSHGHFRIHYDKTGPDAVPSVDLDGNGTPDYIDSTDLYLEYAWDVEINQYKFDAPPDDHRGTGPEIDVYICDLPEDVYGYAYPEEDNPTDRPNTVNGLLVLDNDYSESLYTTKGIAGIKVTSAHEFNHIIQFSRYKYQYSAEATLYEATAVWFERQVHPTIPDYRQYVRGFLAHPDSFAFSTNHVQDAITGYAHVLYLDYLAKRIDRDITRRIWEEFKKHDFVTESVDAALQPSSLNFENSYCEFATWCYYTGARAQEEKYFPEAQIYPTMRAVTIPPRPLNDETVIVGSLYPLSFGLYEVTAIRSGSSIRDTIDFVITNGRTDYGHGGVGIKREDFTLTVSRTEKPGYLSLPYDGAQIYYRLDAASTTHFCIERIIAGESIISLATSVFPQPFINDGADQLVFGVNMAADQIRSVQLSIYSSSLTPVADIKKTTLSEVNNHLGVVWNGKDLSDRMAPSGIYFYELSINGASPTLGKFAVVRK